MGIEIERKFLVVDDSWRAQAGSSKRMQQAYLSKGAERSIRVRISDNEAYLNIKSSRDGIRRLEYEYAIPVEEAVELIDQVALKPSIDKTRYYIRQGKHTWEIDEFYGDNAGLVIAEIELDDESEHFDKPDWLGAEVSSDPRYYNMNLISHPFSQWEDSSVS